MGKAQGTTLGADNGIGMASALAVLDDENIKHGPLEVLLTMTEETGMVGALAYNQVVTSGYSDQYRFGTRRRDLHGLRRRR